MTENTTSCGNKDSQKRKGRRSSVCYNHQPTFCLHLWALYCICIFIYIRVYIYICIHISCFVFQLTCQRIQTHHDLKNLDVSVWSLISPCSTSRFVASRSKRHRCYRDFFSHHGNLRSFLPKARWSCISEGTFAIKKSHPGKRKKV